MHGGSLLKIDRLWMNDWDRNEWAGLDDTPFLFSGGCLLARSWEYDYEW